MHACLALHRNIQFHHEQCGCVFFLRTFLQSSFIRLNISFIFLSFTLSFSLCLLILIIFNRFWENYMTLLAWAAYTSLIFCNARLSHAHTHTHTIIWHWRQIDLDRLNMCFILYFMQPKIKRCCCFFCHSLIAIFSRIIGMKPSKKFKEVDSFNWTSQTNKHLRIKNPKVEKKIQAKNSLNVVCHLTTTIVINLWFNIKVRLRIEYSVWFFAIVI